MVDIDIFWCIYFLLSRPCTEQYRSTLYDLYLHGLSGENSNWSLYSEFSHLWGSCTVGSVRRNGFQSSCKINNFHVFSQHITFQFPLLFFNTVHLSRTCLYGFSCVLLIPVSELCKSKQRTVEVWMNGFGLFGFSGTFSLLLYCRIVLDYCIFFFEGEGLGWHLLQYCGDYLKIVNCTVFTIVVFVFSVGISYKDVFFDCFSFFPLRLWKIKLYSSKSLSSPQHIFFSELWLREILKL